MYNNIAIPLSKHLFNIDQSSFYIYTHIVYLTQLLFNVNYAAC